VEDGKASVLLNTAVYGDVTIVVYHARSAFGGKVQGKVRVVIMLLCCIVSSAIVDEELFSLPCVRLFVCKQGNSK